MGVRTVTGQHCWDVDVNAMLRVNAMDEVATSPLDAQSLNELLVQAFYVRGIAYGEVAFLIAFDQTADYQSPNFRWFKERLTRFVYIDRVVVAATHRRQGLAKSLYKDLIEVARMTGHTALTCEVNALPANPASDAFHAALGFREIGRQSLDNGKIVRYLERHL